MDPEDQCSCSPKKTAIGLLLSLTIGLMLALWITNLNPEQRTEQPCCAQTEQVAFAQTIRRGHETPGASSYKNAGEEKDYSDFEEFLQYLNNSNEGTFEAKESINRSATV